MKSTLALIASISHKNEMRMLLGCLILFVGLNLNAQSPSDYRIVDGHLYNVPLSIMWTEVPPLNKGATTFSGTVHSVKSDYILVEVKVGSYWNVENHEWQNRIVLIKNHPKQKVFTGIP
jgi:hypothetical protein